MEVFRERAQQSSVTISSPLAGPAVTYVAAVATTRARRPRPPSSVFRRRLRLHRSVDDPAHQSDVLVSTARRCGRDRAAEHGGGEDQSNIAEVPLNDLSGFTRTSGHRPLPPQLVVISTHRQHGRLAAKPRLPVLLLPAAVTLTMYKRYRTARVATDMSPPRYFKT